MSQFSTDVVVVGAGPAGSAAALFLARRGYDVTLLDRAVFPRDKPCGEYLTPGAVALLRDEIGILPQLLAAGASELTRETVVPHNGRAFSGLTSALACPRIVSDNTLRLAAETAGVRVLENFKVRQIEHSDNGFSGVSGENSAGERQKICAKIVVGADGTRSLVARTMGVVRARKRLQRIALVTHYQSEEIDGAGVTMHLPFDHSDACCGVGAVCGLERTYNVNIVVPITESLLIAGRRQEYFEGRLSHSFPQVWEKVRESVQVGPLHSVGCFGHHTSRATADGALLIGDAATFIHPFTGEGVYFALRGAQLAAETLDLAFQSGDVSRRTLSRYDAARHSELLPRYRLCDLVQRVVHSPSLLRWGAERLRRSEPLTDLLLRTAGDMARPTDLLSLPALQMALATF